MPLLDAFEKWTIPTLPATRYVIKVAIVAGLVADIALDVVAARPSASHLVASVLLDKRSSAFVALPNQGCRHGFFDSTPGRVAVLAGSLLACFGNMCLSSAQTTANDLALWVLAAELLVDLDFGILGRKGAEWTGLEVFDPCKSEGLFLLDAFESNEELAVEEQLLLVERESSITPIGRHAPQSILGEPDLRLRHAPRTFLAKILARERI